MIPEPRVASNMYDREGAILTHTCLKPPMGCGRVLTQVELDSWDALSVKEYKQSGWCLSCQNKIFQDPDELYNERVCQCDDEPCCEADVGIGVMYCNHRSEHCPVHKGYWPEVPSDYDDWMGVNNGFRV